MLPQVVMMMVVHAYAVVEPMRSLGEDLMAALSRQVVVACIVGLLLLPQIVVVASFAFVVAFVVGELGVGVREVPFSGLWGLCCLVASPLLLARNVERHQQVQFFAPLAEVP